MRAGEGYQAITEYIVTGKSATLGYYLYALAPIQAVLLLTGLVALVPFRHRLKPVGFVTVMMLTIEAFGNWLLFLPYVCGLVQHQPAGNVQALNLSNLSMHTVVTLIERLTANKPEFITPPVIVAMIVFYACSTFILLTLSFRLPKS